MAAINWNEAGKVSDPCARLIVTSLSSSGWRSTSSEVVPALVRGTRTIAPVPARGAELGQLIQEEHPVMGERNLARMWPVAAAHQPGVADGVAGGADVFSTPQFRHFSDEGEM